MPIVRSLLEAMRPWQWTKNLLLFAPLLFAHLWSDAAAVRWTLVGFASLCCAASGLYVLNDLLDREADRSHEQKRHRPIASGRLPVRAAVLASCVLLAVAAVLAALVPFRKPPPSALPGGIGIGLPFWGWLLAYAAQTTLYSLWLKHVVIVDCLILALGFLLRVLAGGAAAAVECSSWIVLCTFFFALFLALCKRREEVARHGEARGATRQSLRDYDLPFLDQLIAPLAALSILSYALYTVSEETALRHGNRNLQVTVPFVVFGVFRYLFLVHRHGEGMDPARALFRDRQLLASGVLWLIAVALAL